MWTEPNTLECSSSAANTGTAVAARIATTAARRCNPPIMAVPPKLSYRDIGARRPCCKAPCRQSDLTVRPMDCRYTPSHESKNFAGQASAAHTGYRRRWLTREIQDCPAWQDLPIRFRAQA